MSTLREKFERELKIRGRSERTVHAYIASVSALAVYHQKSPDRLSDEQIRDWLLHLVVARRLSGSSVNCAVQAVRAFQCWVLGRERADTVRGVPRGKRATTRAEVYALAEIAAILAAAPAGRDRAFLTTVYAGGLRLDEARHLQTGDLDAARGQLRVRRGKGAKARVLPYPETLDALLRDYWRTDRAHRPGYFPAEDGTRNAWLFAGAGPDQPLSKGTAQNICLRAAAAAGVRRKKGIHSLRRSYATHLLEAGGALDGAGHWHAAKRAGYLFPLGAMGALFRGKFLAGLNALKATGAVPAPPAGWPKLWKALGHTPWIVYCKKPFAGPAQVLAYLANYTHRVALSERRLVAVDAAARTVTFRWRDYRETSGPPDAAQKLCTLDADEFLRRFRTHLLPHRFTKIRHYGLLANAARARLVPLARAAIAALAPGKKAAAAGRKKEGATMPPADATPWPPPCAHCGGMRVAFLGLTLAGGTVVAAQALAAAGPVCAAAVRAPP